MSTLAALSGIIIAAGIGTVAGLVMGWLIGRETGRLEERRGGW